MRSIGHVHYKFLTEPDLDPALVAEALAMTSFFHRRMGFVFAASPSEDDDRLILRPQWRLWTPEASRATDGLRTTVVMRAVGVGQREGPIKSG